MGITIGMTGDSNISLPMPHFNLNNIVVLIPIRLNIANIKLSADKTRSLAYSYVMQDISQK
jgi:hypothetical protein